MSQERSVIAKIQTSARFLFEKSLKQVPHSEKIYCLPCFSPCGLERVSVSQYGWLYAAL